MTKTYTLAELEAARQAYLATLDDEHSTEFYLTAREDARHETAAFLTHLATLENA